MRAAGGEGDHERVLVDARQARDRVLARAGDDLGADVEQRQQVAQVAGEEGELVHADDHHPVRRAERGDAGLDLLAGEVADRLLDVRVIGGQRGLELGVVEVEQRAPCEVPVSAGAAAAVLLDRRLLKLGIALEAERLREADDGRRRGVGAAGELLGGLEGGLVEVVDDVAGDVLLRARELVEAFGDVGGERLAVRTRRDARRPLDGGRSAGGAGESWSRSWSRRVDSPHPRFSFSAASLQPRSAPAPVGAETDASRRQPRRAAPDRGAMSRAPMRPARAGTARLVAAGAGHRAADVALVAIGTDCPGASQFAIERETADGSPAKSRGERPGLLADATSGRCRADETSGAGRRLRSAGARARSMISAHDKPSVIAPDGAGRRRVRHRWHLDWSSSGPALGAVQRLGSHGSSIRLVADWIYRVLMWAPRSPCSLARSSARANGSPGR